MIIKTILATRYGKKILSPIILVVMLLAALSSLALISQTNALPQTFTVTNSNGSGVGSLSQAIQDANTNGNPGEVDVIDFNIGDPTQTHIIEPTTQIVLVEPVLINGFTQPGSSQNTTAWPYPMDAIIRIEVSLASTESLRVESPNVELRGLAVNLGTGTALDLTDADNFKLSGSYIHTDYTGLRALREDDPWVPGFDPTLEVISIKGSDGVDIGGASAAERNIIGGCTNFCILAKANGPTPTTNLNIENNYITVGADWFTSVAHNDQGRGIGIKEGSTNVRIHQNAMERVWNDVLYVSDSDYIDFTGNRVFNSGGNNSGDGPSRYTVSILGSKHTTIGSSGPEDRNLFGGNNSGAIVVANSNSNRTSEDVAIENNSFGYAGDDTTSFSNTDTSVLVRTGSEFINIKNNKIHNADGGSANGIGVEGAANVSIVGNSIYNNQLLGIDLGSDGPNNNDSLDTDTGANDLLNYPEWYNVQEGGGDTIVDFTADLPSGDYRVEFFSNTVADPSGKGEGEVYLGYANITSTGAPENFAHTLTGITGVTNLALTATEIDGASPNGFGATSEFGGEGVEYITPEEAQDLSIEKTLDDPQNYVQGGTVQYTVNLTNTGDNSIDLTTLDGSAPNPLEGSLFVDFLAPGMNFNSVVSGDSSCTAAGTLSSVDPGNPAWANHQDYTAVFCAYTGANTSFEPNETISVTISVSLAPDFNTELPNTAIAGHVYGDEGVIRSGECYGYVTGPDNTGGTDFVDCLLGPPSAFTPDIAQNEIPYPGLAITKTLTDPQDFTQNGEITYTVTVSNDGTADLDLSPYDGSDPNPLAGSLFVDYIPPDMTFLSDNNSDVSCTVAPASIGTLGGPIWANHAAYGGMFCAYSGLDTSLDPAEQISVDLTFQLSADSDLNYTNHVTPGWVPQDPGSSIAGGCLNSASQPGATQDALDCLVADTSGDADIAWAGAPTDIDISQTFSAPNGVSAGSAVSYTYTFTNNGPGDVSLPWYREFTPLFLSIFPGEDLTFTSSTSPTPDIGCFDVGPGSAIFAGTIAEDHTSHNLLTCNYSGTDNLTLALGESITITINATVNGGSDGQFTNYLMHGTTPSDPDSNSIYQVLTTATEDQLDTLEGYSMFSRLSYPSGSNSGGEDNGDNSSNSQNGGLSETGESIKLLALVGVILLVFASIAYLKERRRLQLQPRSK